MSLLPFILDDFHCLRPSRISNQHFGMGLDPDDLLSPFTIAPTTATVLRVPGSYYRPWRTTSAEKDTGSVVSMDKDKFQVKLDVQHFSPDEITVKVTGENTVTVEGKHEDKQDEHGYVSRHFVRKYKLPEEHDINQVVSSLSSDGVLTITAPRTGQPELESRNIPIQQTGIPSKAVQNKEEKKGKDDLKE